MQDRPLSRLATPPKMIHGWIHARRPHTATRAVLQAAVVPRVIAGTLVLGAMHRPSRRPHAKRLLRPLPDVQSPARWQVEGGAVLFPVRGVLVSSVVAALPLLVVCCVLATPYDARRPTHLGKCGWGLQLHSGGGMGHEWGYEVDSPRQLQPLV